MGNAVDKFGATGTHVFHINSTRADLLSNLDICQWGQETDTLLMAYRDHLGGYHSVQQHGANLDVLSGLTFAANKAILLTGSASASVGKITNSYLSNLGTQNYLAKYGNTGFADSLINDTGSYVGINIANPLAILQVKEAENYTCAFETYSANGTICVGIKAVSNDIATPKPLYFYASNFYFSFGGAVGFMKTDINGLVSIDTAAHVSGTGTQYYVPLWNNAGGTTIGNSLIRQDSAGSYVGIGMTPVDKFQIREANDYTLVCSTYSNSGVLCVGIKALANDLGESKPLYLLASSFYLSLGRTAGGLKVNTDGLISIDTNTYLTSVTPHNLLSSTHGDTLADSVVRGDLMRGMAYPAAWGRLAKGNTGDVLRADATDVTWASLATAGIQAALTNPVCGTGTQYTIPLWATTATLGNSILFQDANATYVLISAANALKFRDVNTSIYSSGSGYLRHFASAEHDFYLGACSPWNGLKLYQGGSANPVLALSDVNRTYWWGIQGGLQSADLLFTLPTAYPGGTYALTCTTGGVMGWAAFQAALTNPVTGTGTQYAVPLWATTGTLGNSIITQDAGATTATITGSCKVTGLSTAGVVLNSSAGLLSTTIGTQYALPIWSATGIGNSSLSQPGGGTAVTCAANLNIGTATDPRQLIFNGPANSGIYGIYASADDKYWSFSSGSSGASPYQLYVGHDNTSAGLPPGVHTYFGTSATAAWNLFRGGSGTSAFVSVVANSNITIYPDSGTTIFQSTTAGVETRWNYSANYLLELVQNVASGHVWYSFDHKNNGTAYASNLVIDRGMVGINNLAPTCALDVVGAAKISTTLTLPTLSTAGILTNTAAGLVSSTIGSNNYIPIWTTTGLGSSYLNQSGANVGIGAVPVGLGANVRTLDIRGGAAGVDVGAGIWLGDTTAGRAAFYSCGLNAYLSGSAGNLYIGNSGSGTLIQLIGTAVGIKTPPTAVLTLGNTTGVTAPGNIVLNFRDSSYTTYGWDFLVESSATGDMELHRVINNVSTAAMHFQRATGYVGIGMVPTSLLDVAGALSTAITVSAATTKTLGAANSTWVSTYYDTIFTLPTASTCPGRIYNIVLDNTNHCESANSDVIPPGSATPGTAICRVSTDTWAILQSDGTYWRIIARGA